MRTVVTKLTVAFRNFPNALEIKGVFIRRELIAVNTDYFLTFRIAKSV